MEHIIWTDDFSVGVRMIDEQHKEIISLVNRLASDKDVTVRAEIISETLTKMTKYAGSHFKTEEELMLKYGYPDYNSHKILHVNFIKKTVVFCAETMKYSKGVPNEIFSYLREWWVNHILGADMKYKDFFQKLGIK